MKITMLSEIDYAGSGHKLCQAIRSFTKHDIEIYSGTYYNPFGHSDHSRWNKEDVQNRIDESDIVHLKGDWPPRNRYLGLNILHKPIVITVGGSHFRKARYGGYGKYDLQEYGQAAVRTAFTPDLCYEDFIWTPHPIDSWDKKIVSHKEDVPILMHIPTRRDIKGTDFVFDIFGGLKDLMDVKTLVIEDMPFRRVVEERKRATIYFDQFKVGFYGNSAIEAMAYGIPVAAWIRPDLNINGCPVITEDRDADKWVEKIFNILNGSLDAEKAQAKVWCDSIHSYESVAKQWNEIYASI